VVLVLLLRAKRFHLTTVFTVGVQAYVLATVLSSTRATHSAIHFGHALHTFSVP